MPAFFQFQCDTGWVGGGVMRSAVARCWEVLKGSSAEVVGFVSVAECERAMPDSEGCHASDYTSAAIDAVDIACNLLAFVENGDIELIVRSITAQCDTIDLFVQNNEALNGPAKVDCSPHSLLKEELDLMQADLDFLRAIDVDETMLFAAVLMRVSALEYRTLRLKLSHFLKVGDPQPAPPPPPTTPLVPSNWTIPIM